MNYKITALAILVFSAAAFAQGEFSFNVTPMQPGNSDPMVFLAHRELDIGIDVAGSGSTINPTDFRPGFYAFTGEMLTYKVLVRDLNGAADIMTVKGTRGGAQEVLCTQVSLLDLLDETNSTNQTCAGLNHLNTGGNISINDDVECVARLTNLQWDAQTDRIYKCKFTVASTWLGTLITVVANDTGNNSGSMVPENWTFNPALEIDVDTSTGGVLAFGPIIQDQNTLHTDDPNCVRKSMGGGDTDLTNRECQQYNPTDIGDKKCDISFSTNKLVIRNVGVTNLWAFIAATDFSASTGIALCPFTNNLDNKQFEYRAISGSFDSGWRVMPQHAPNLGCSGIGYTLAPIGQCRGACRIPVGDVAGLPGLDILSPGLTIEVQLKIVWPTPCIGNFDTGQVKVVVRAV